MLNTPLNPLSRGEVFFIALQNRRLVIIKFKALKERPNIAPGEAAKPGVLRNPINPAEQRASFEMKGRNEAGELRLN